MNIHRRPKHCVPSQKEIIRLGDSLEFCSIDYKKKGDFGAFRGPENVAFFDRGVDTSVNVWSKPCDVVYTHRTSGLRMVERWPAFTPYDYTRNQKLGPFYVLSTEDDTEYWCIKHPTDFRPLEFIMLNEGESHLISGDNWAVARMTGNLAGEMFYLEDGNTIVAEGLTCVARLL